MATGDLEHELDRLYALPAAEFTSARDALVRRLRAEDRRDEADRVKGLRKPTLPVWLANRLSREAEVDVQRLLRAGEALGASQAEAAAGREAEGFAAARRDEHDALERLARAAHAVAEREGLGAPVVDRAVRTLRAASLSDEGRELLKRGRLTEELEQPGFEALAGLPAAAPRRRAKKAGPRAEAPRGRALDEARRALRTLEGRARELSSAARKAERDAERAEAEASRLRGKADGARAEANEVERRVADARAEVERQRGGSRGRRS